MAVTFRTRNQSPVRAEKRRHQVFMTKLDDGSATRSLPLTTIAKPMNRFAACGDPRAEAQGARDDQGRNDRLVQNGPEGVAASAHVMGRPQDREPYWGYRRWSL